MRPYIAWTLQCGMVAGLASEQLAQGGLPGVCAADMKLIIVVFYAKLNIIVIVTLLS